MYKGKSIKFISIIVIISMVLNLIPLNVYGIESIVDNVKDENIIETDIQSEAKIKGEIIDKREKNIKYFLMDNNTVEAQIYKDAVHYMKDGKWEDIDNSLSEVSDTDGQKVSENKSNNFKVKFANISSDKKLISIKSDKLDMKWSLQGAKKVKVQPVTYDENLNKINGNEDKRILKNISSSVIYPDILKDVDITYDVISENVKENIILKSLAASENKFIFNMNIGDLEAKLNEDKSISIYNSKNEVISKIESPYMYDSALEYSDSLDVSLTKIRKII